MLSIQGRKIMQSAYRIVKRLENRHLVIDLPADFPETAEAEIIVLPLDTADEATGRLLMREWLDRAWGCAPDFPDRPEQPPLDDVQPL
ncbi:MAG: hypothetical protein P9F75_02540 [Candidatus Contendobacter sp.]|nr:hypothetical protein [Candidatus Contendobacter sp.]